MFIEQYKLESNPFAPDGIRPTFMSQSMRYAQLKLEHLLEGRLQSLFLSGVAGVGKSTLIEQQLRAREGIFVSWVEPGAKEPEFLLRKLVNEIGPGDVYGSAAELRNILEVFLRHQAGQGRVCVVVADALERLALPLIRELEGLSRMRLRGRPILHCVMVTRNEDLIRSMMSQQEDTRLAPSLHQRLAGFTLDETRAYVHACLHGAGCAWVEELVPEEAIVDIQGFTQGVAGDINALCRLALEAVAARSSQLQQARVTRAILKDAGAALRLRYDPSVWQQKIEESLSPDAVQVSDPAELRVEAARLVVSSGGSIVAEISLNRPRMVLGRDAACDISLDSSYVSRYQNLFMETPDGWLLIDLNSTNGSFVNGRRVQEHPLRDGDLIAVGQHQLRFTSPSGRERPDTDDGRDRGEDTIVSPKPIIGKRA
ncbi:MAG: FHA domain-containing protein [Gammaproteobacteria bacterium]|nr:FHA domain-containing protein [Gammaproteobacteria bacterium]